MQVAINLFTQYLHNKRIEYKLILYVGECMFLKNRFVILYFLIFISLLEAKSFDNLLKDALSKDYNLKSDDIDIKKEIIDGTISTRWDNPNLEVELSRFDEKLDDIDFRTSISQSVPLPSFQRDKELLSMNKVTLRKSTYRLNRAKYIKNLSLLYAEYIAQSMFYKNSISETDIAKDIYSLVEARELLGSVSRGELLRAKVDYSMALEAKKSIELSKQKSYYRLLNYANISKNIKLDTSYNFKLMSNRDENPEITIIKNSIKINNADAKVKQHIVESVSLFGEYEEDRGEGVMRFGLSLPLGINSQKKEEKQLAKLEAHKNSLKLERDETKLKISILALREEAKILNQLQEQNRKIISQEKILLNKFQEAYRIATINLMELQEIKNRLVSNQRRLIKIKFSKNKNSIEQNYILGAYND